MRKRIITSISYAAIAIAAMAQSETPDSIKTKELGEVVVEAQNQRTDAKMSTFTPTGRQKSSAQNAIDLLRQLAIPQINLNLVDNAVTTQSGQNVAIFINYLPASSEEIEGILTTDVRRVEYLDFPTDPRFQGHEWKTQARMTPASKVDLTPENNLFLTPEEFGRRGQFYFGLSAFEGFELTDAFAGERDTVCGVDDAVEDGIRHCGVADGVVPVQFGEL